jgi:hypothetical protein
MTKKHIPVRIPDELFPALDTMMQDQGYDNPGRFASDIICAYISSRAGHQRLPDDLRFETEMLRMRVDDLTDQLRRKEEELSLLLSLWEQCPVREGEREVSPEVDEKISRLMENWIDDSERKDFSGADGEKPGHV